MTAAVFALIFAAEVDPNAMLARVAEHYAGLQTYAVETEMRLVVNGHPGSPSKTRIEAGAGNRYFYHHGLDTVEFTPAMPPVTIISDGQSVYRDDGRAAGVLDEATAILSHREVQRAMKLLHGRFATLDGPAMHARFVKSEKVRGRLCAVVKINGDPDELPESWDDVLWIDIESATVLRSQYTRVLRERHRRVTEDRTYTLPPGTRPPDESLFRIKPGARRRQ